MSFYHFRKSLVCFADNAVAGEGHQTNAGRGVPTDADILGINGNASLAAVCYACVAAYYAVFGNHFPHKIQLRCK